MKKLILFALVALFVSSAAGQVYFQGTFDDALIQAKNDGKLVLINFFSGG